jgi:hypothetical protein
MSVKKLYRDRGNLMNQQVQADSEREYDEITQKIIEIEIDICWAERGDSYS